MTIGQKIKQRREQLGWSQDELASKMGYKSRSTINKIESGINDISQTKIYLFAKALDVNPVWLLGLDVPMENEKNPTTDNGDEISPIAKEFASILDNLDSSRQEKLLELARLYLNDLNKDE